MPITFWCTVLGGALSFAGGFGAKLISEYRDQLAKDRQTLLTMHRLLGELGVFLVPTIPTEFAEQRLGKSRDELEIELRRLPQDIRCRKYRPLAVEAMMLAYNQDRNIQYMLKKLRAAVNPKLFNEVKRQTDEAIGDGRLSDLRDYMSEITTRKKQAPPQ